MLQSGATISDEPDLVPRRRRTGAPNRPTLAWEAADGRRAWNRTPEQDREIRRRSRQGFAYTVVYETGELVFHRRRATHPHWWRRGADDPNVKAARQAQRLHAVRAGQGRPAALTPLPRRTPPARPAARRASARRSLGPRSSQDPGDGEPHRSSFDRFHRAQADLSGAGRLAVFAALPADVQGLHWEALAAELEGGAR
jgi:hypothetical protein